MKTTEARVVSLQYSAESTFLHASSKLRWTSFSKFKPNPDLKNNTH